ncbi:hypothetical protein DFH09DRAFT_1081914 [Mycena vulgaris]|nr:hypothetical protein DFH09DRAFT_1081914 [Mycena vulgaris]
MSPGTFSYYFTCVQLVLKGKITLQTAEIVRVYLEVRVLFIHSSPAALSTQPKLLKGHQQSYAPWSESRVELGGALKAFHTGPTAVGRREREWLKKYNHLNASIYSSTVPRIDLKYFSGPQKYTRPLGRLGTACNSDQTFERLQTGSKPLCQTFEALPCRSKVTCYLLNRCPASYSFGLTFGSLDCLCAFALQCLNAETMTLSVQLAILTERREAVAMLLYFKARTVSLYSKMQRPRPYAGSPSLVEPDAETMTIYLEDSTTPLPWVEVKARTEV